MAFTDRDIWLSQFIKRAMEFKKRPENWGKQAFQGIEFDPWINKWTHDIFLERKLPYYVNLFKDKKVFDTVYENLARKPELKFLYNPLALKDDPEEKGLPKELHDQIEKEAAEADPKGAEEVYGGVEEKARHPREEEFQEDQASETTGTEANVTMTSSAEQSGLPTTSNSSAGSTNIRTRSTKTPNLQSGSTQNNATTSSVSAGATKVSFGSAAASASSTTSSSSSTFTTSTSYSAPKAPEELIRARKNFFSSAGRLFNRNLGKFLTIGNIGTVVAGTAGAFAGLGMTAGSSWGALMGGAGGVAGRFWIGGGGANKFLGRLGNGFANSMGRLSDAVAGPKFSIAKPKGKVVLGAVGIFMLAFIFLNISSVFLPGGPGGASSAQAAPITPSSSTGAINDCKFTRSNISLPIQSSTLVNWITQAANAADIPPQILASVAMHENAGFVAVKRDDDPAIKNNEFCNKGVIFCEKSGQVLHSKDGVDDPCTSDEIAQGARTAQAVGLMQNLDIYNVGKNLCSITESLSIAAAKLKANGLTAQPTQDQVNNSIKAFYNSCIYGSYSYCDEAWKDLQNCQPKPSSVVTEIASCPVPNGSISTHSYQIDPKNGHCSDSYGFSCRCKTEGRRAKAIDVPTAGKVVILPKIGFQEVKWKLIVGPYLIDDSEGGGVGYTFETQVGTDKWYLDMLHLNQTSLSKGIEYPSGTEVATTAADHVHMTIGKNLASSPVAGTNTDCDPGWLPSDFMCQ